MFKNLKTNGLGFIYFGVFCCLGVFGLVFHLVLFCFWFCLFLLLLVFMLVVCFFPDSLTVPEELCLKYFRTE